ncbi:uncharacterized protein TRAVEDRAFT_17896 [Trametes versicolor FP-101664 SS1]|uniref:uncharacterized protein n=1 Tax=Trametes versicolor (strain FP-101664) TaxID=717944 RepID=UPI0004623E8F|nr:uncharacterized protein TRAVEDRAFT_17896 [Trametes versicolor FP-101664 SS1]EIW63614.1 hypothetical protein TRAVEDRAFT_17896 [Trametes versicolor FP-101664 SS1]
MAAPLTSSTRPNLVLLLAGPTSAEPASVRHAWDLIYRHSVVFPPQPDTPAVAEKGTVHVLGHATSTGDSETSPTSPTMTLVDVDEPTPKWGIDSENHRHAVISPFIGASGSSGLSSSDASGQFMLLDRIMSNTSIDVHDANMPLKTQAYKVIMVLDQSIPENLRKEFSGAKNKLTAFKLIVDIGSTFTPTGRRLTPIRMEGNLRHNENPSRSRSRIDEDGAPVRSNAGISERAASKKPARPDAFHPPRHEESAPGPSRSSRPETHSFHTARSSTQESTVNPGPSARTAADRDDQPSSRPSSVHLTPPSPTPRRASKRDEIHRESRRSANESSKRRPTSRADGPVESTTPPPRGNTSPLPAPTARHASAYGFFGPEIHSSTPTGAHRSGHADPVGSLHQEPLLHRPDSRESTRSASRAQSQRLLSPDYRAILEHQAALNYQASQRNEQLAENAIEMRSFAHRGHSFVVEYLNDVNAMSSRLNRVLGDNARTVKDIANEMNITRQILGVPIPAPHPENSGAQAPPRSASVPVSEGGRSSVTLGHEDWSPLGPNPSPPHEHRDTPPHLGARPESGQRQRSPGVHQHPPGPNHTAGPYGERVISPRYHGENIDEYNDRMRRGLDRHTRVRSAMRPIPEEHANERVRFAEPDHSHSPSARSPRLGDAPYRDPREYLREYGPRRSDGYAPQQFAVPPDDGGFDARQWPGNSISTAAHLRPRLATTTLDPRMPMPPTMYGLPGPAGITDVPTAVNSVAVGTVRYQDAMLTQLCRNIRFKVGVRRPKLPDGAKFPKIDGPGKYNGDNDHRVFYTWLDGYLSWLRAYNLCGDETDDERVRLMRTFLSGPAEEWFSQEVDHPSLSYHPGFEQAICAMHRRFVHASSAAKATQDFENVKYVASEGVDSFAANLRQAGQLMVVPPHEYELARRFLNGLPTEIYNVVVVHRGLRSEYMPLADILEHARQVEESRRMLRARDKIDRTSTTMAHSRSEDKRPASANRREPYRRDEPRVRSAPRAGSRDDAARAVAGGNNRPRVPANGGTCFACGKPGHFANDPVCSEFGKRIDRPGKPQARLHAQRLDYDGDDELISEAGSAAEREAPLAEDDGWAGSQYDSGPASEDEASEVERRKLQTNLAGTVPPMLPCQGW